MAAVDRVVIDINVDVDKRQLDTLITRLAALQAISEDLTHKFDGLARSSREFNDGLRRSHSNLRNVNTEIDRAAGRFKNAADKIEATNKKLDDSNRKLKANADLTQQVNKKLDDHDRKINRSNRSHMRFARGLQRVMAPLKKFMMTLGKMSFVALAGQMGLFTLGLLSVKLALITGRAAVEVYNIALKGLSVTAAGVTTALAVAAAAMRQFNEAMLIPSVGGGMTRRGAQNSALLARSLGSQTTGLLGGEASTALIASFAKAGVSRSATEGMSRQLINLTGGDAAAVQAIAKAIGSKDAAELRSALSGAAGFKADSLAEGLSTNQLLAALASGSIVSENYQGVGTGLAGTFIGTAKTEFSGMKNMFADMGQPLLNPFREAMMDMARILRENFLGMSVLIQKFGADSFAPTLVTLVEKTMDFIRSNIFDHIENIEQMGKSFVGFFRGVRDFFHGIGAFLVQFEPAADVVIEMFQAMGATGGGRGLFRSFSDLIVKNAEAFKQFGSSIGNVFGAIFDLLKSGQSGFFGNLDLFSEIMNRVASEFIPAIGGLLEKFVPILENLPSAIDGLSSVLEILTPIVGAFTETVGFIMGLGKYGAAAGGLGMFGLLMALKNPVGAARFGGAIFGGANKATTFAANNPGAVAAAQKALPGMLGGAMVVGGAISNYQSGPGFGGSMSQIAGGAMLGSYFGPQGAVVGAILGGVSAAVSGFFGRRERDKRGEEAIERSVEAVADLSTFAPGTSFADIKAGFRLTEELFSTVQNLPGSRKNVYDDILFGELVEGEGSFFRRNVLYQIADTFSGGTGEQFVIDRQSDEAKALIEFFKSRGEDISGLSASQFTEAFMPGGDLRKALAAEAIMNQANELYFDYNVDMLRSATEMTTEEIESVGLALGIDFTSGLLDATNAAAVFSAQMLPLIERTRAFFPDFATSPLGQAEARATANAAFTSLANADTMTVDLVRDAFEAFAAYEISLGMSPDIAGFSSNFELIEKVLPNLSPDKQQALLAMLATGSFEMATAISDAYKIPIEQILAFAGDDNIIGSEIGELTGIETFIAERAGIRSALNATSGLSASERYTYLATNNLLPAGFAPQFRSDLMADLTEREIDFDESARTQDLLAQVDASGGNAVNMLLQALTTGGYVTEAERLANESNQSLLSLVEDMSVLRGTVDGTSTLNVAVTSFLAERGADPGT